MTYFATVMLKKDHLLLSMTNSKEGVLWLRKFYTLPNMYPQRSSPCKKENCLSQFLLANHCVATRKEHILTRNYTKK
jgi:hypothetical protein